MNNKHNDQQSRQANDSLPQARKQDDTRSMNDQRRGSAEDTLTKDEFNKRENERVSSQNNTAAAMSVGSNNAEAEALEDVDEQAFNDTHDEDVVSEMKIRSNGQSENDKKPAKKTSL